MKKIVALIAAGIIDFVVLIILESEGITVSGWGYLLNWVFMMIVYYVFIGIMEGDTIEHDDDKNQ